MKKNYSLLTTTEKLVVKKNKTIVFLCIVLAISLGINVFYIIGADSKLPKYQLVKVDELQEENVEETQVNNVVDDSTTEDAAYVEETKVKEETDERTVVASDKDNSVNTEGTNENDTEDNTVAEEEKEPTNIAQQLYDTDDEELIAAVLNHYENAKVMKSKISSKDRLTIVYDDERYEFDKYNEYISFSCNEGGCEFSEETVNKLYDLIGQSELKIFSLRTYVNSKGKVMEVGSPKRYIFGQIDYNSYKFFPTDNMEEILDFCRELRDIMLE